MVKKILRKTVRKIDKKDKENDLGILMKDMEIFNANKEIISRYIKNSSMDIINVGSELLKTGMFAS